MSDESPLLGSWMAVSLLCPHVMKGMKELSFIRALITTLDSSPPTPLSWKEMDGIKPKVWDVTGLWC